MPGTSLAKEVPGEKGNDFHWAVFQKGSPLLWLFVGYLLGMKSKTQLYGVYMTSTSHMSLNGTQIHFGGNQTWYISMGRFWENSRKEQMHCLGPGVSYNDLCLRTACRRWHPTRQEGSPTPEALARIQLRTTTCDRWKFGEAKFTEVDQGFEVASRESSRLESLDFHLWGAQLVRFQSLIQSIISIHIYYISHINVLDSTYIYISCIPCSSFGPNASCFNITRINSPVTWHLIIGAAHQGLMEMWKANYPSDIQDLEHCMTATPRREDVDKFIIRKAVDASKRG